MHYNRANSYLYVTCVEIHKFHAKDSEIKVTSLCLGKTSKDFSVDSMKNIGFNGYVYDSSINYEAISVDDILDIHKYLKQSMV